MRILYLSQYFPPEMGAPAARVFELSREWASLGHDVTVLERDQIATLLKSAEGRPAIAHQRCRERSNPVPAGPR